MSYSNESHERLMEEHAALKVINAALECENTKLRAFNTTGAERLAHLKARNAKLHEELTAIREHQKREDFNNDLHRL